MLELPAISVNTCTKALTPLVDCVINDALTEVSPFLDQALLEMLHVTYPRPIHPFLKHPRDLVVHWVEVWTVWWPECWWDESGSVTS